MIFFMKPKKKQNIIVSFCLRSRQNVTPSVDDRLWFPIIFHGLSK